jgi:hypothetical protein
MGNEIGIKWIRLSNEEIVTRFSEHDWHNILSDISSDKELHELLQMDFVSGYVAYNRKNVAVAFIMLIEEVWRGNQVQVHGGCWSGSPWDSYNAMIVMLEKLFDEGKSVRSQCTLDNIRAVRFLKSLGFINHYTSDSYRHFWLPYKRFVNSAIYKRLCK